MGTFRRRNIQSRYRPPTLLEECRDAIRFTICAINPALERAEAKRQEREKNHIRKKRPKPAPLSPAARAAIEAHKRETIAKINAVLDGRASAPGTGGGR